MAPASVPTTNHSSSSFWEKNVIGIVVGVAILAILSTLAMTTGTFPQLSTLITGTSQPRFVHQGDAPEEMFDNKTAQACWSGPVQKDDGEAGEKIARKDEEDALKDLNKTLEDYGDACDRVERKYGQDKGRETLACKALLRASDRHFLYFDLENLAQKRVEQLKEHPEMQKVIHVRGLPYCSELK
jgi:hypothetical protein